MEPGSYNQHIYDLANSFFRHAEVVTRDNKIIRGQFVRFRVSVQGGEQAYPGDAYCFLPDEQRVNFWKEHLLNGGVFARIPDCIIYIDPRDISMIILLPKNLR